MSGEQTDHSERSLTRREALQGGSAVVGSAVALDAFTARVMAQSGGPTNEISGVVEDGNGAVQGATVAVVPHDESLGILETTTASDGTYTFDENTLHSGENLYHVIARDGTESSPRRGEQNYPFIAAEGVAAIPDSGILHAVYDSRDLSLSDGNAVTSWADGKGSNDLTQGSGSPQPTCKTNIINSEPVVRHDGVDDYLETSWSTLSQPVTIAFVGVLQTVQSTSRFFLSANTNNHNYGHQNGDDFFMNFGDNSVFGGNPSTDPFIFVGQANGASSIIRINGTQVASGDPGSDGSDGLTTGSLQGSSSFTEIDFGIILVYDGSPTVSDVEQYLDDEYGPILP